EQAIRAIEKAHGTRVITMIHRQERRSLFGFSVARHIDLEDAQTIIAAIKETPDTVPIDLILHTPGGLVLAAMQSIPDELYEAARLDTGSGWAVFRSITFPLIAPALGTVALLRLVETFKILDIPFSMLGGGPGSATQTYSYYVYITGLRNFNMGYASALAYILVIIAIIISTVYFWRVRARFE
ncbi:MAG: ABC transporter permease subunit, partial [Chloroflexi bacterium]|nr:ABC transporter permease subunit [Chloroflexota bacterium]